MVKLVNTLYLGCSSYGIGGSTPPLSKNFYKVEQLAAHQAHDLKVVGSSPTLVTFICLLGEIGKHGRLKIYSS